MDYKKVISDDHNILKLMVSLNLCKLVTKIVEIDLNPDYDITPYQGDSGATYVFKPKIDFPDGFESVIDVEIQNLRILHADDTSSLIRDFQLTYSDVNVDNDLNVINYCQELHAENDPSDIWGLFSQLGCEPNFDDFKLNEISVSDINNNKKTIRLEGGFFGSSYSIDPMDWGLYAELEFFGGSSFDSSEQFYNELLIKSYDMHQKGDHRVSFFLSYSALEGYINIKNESEDVEERLSEKLNKLYKKEFSHLELSKHNIYTTMISPFKKHLTKLRNHIAHGRKQQFDSNVSREMLVVALLFISSIENKKEKLSDLL